MNASHSSEARRGPTAGFALILGVSLVASAAIWSLTFYRAKALENSLSVTGSVKQRITSDVVKWTSSFSRTSAMTQMKDAAGWMEADLAKVIVFFSTHGIAEADLTVSPLSIEPMYRSDGGPAEFTLRQTVRLQSSDVERVTKIAHDASSLMGEGVFFSTQSLEYYYSKLPELRIQMLSGALQDARARADAIAQSSGSRVGRLKSASVGVTQVMQVNSTEVSDYGAYDTSTIEKEVTATVRAAFALR